MKIYYYHTRPILEALQEWKENKHPGHILYGLTHFPKNGIECVLHDYKPFPNRFKLMVYNLKQILFCKEKVDAIYGTSFLGLELLIFLRALGLFRTPIIIWHHTAIVSSPNWLKNEISRFFYRGIDLMFLFSNHLIEESLKTGKVKKEKLKLIHWGADLEFYDRILKDSSLKKTDRFISTGKEHRDFPTLLQAFSETTANLQTFIAKSNGDTDYRTQYDNFFREHSCPSNIRVNFVSGIIPYQLALEVAQSSVVVISCLPFSYTVGLTTLVEAIALGLPVITTDNPWFEMNLDKEKAGICVDYGDIDGWKKAINECLTNPQKAAEMGKNGRLLAEKKYNLENYTCEMATAMKDFFARKRKTA